MEAFAITVFLKFHFPSVLHCRLRYHFPLHKYFIATDCCVSSSPVHYTQPNSPLQDSRGPVGPAVFIFSSYPCRLYLYLIPELFFCGVQFCCSCVFQLSSLKHRVNVVIRVLSTCWKQMSIIKFCQCLKGWRQQLTMDKSGKWPWQGFQMLTTLFHSTYS